MKGLPIIEKARAFGASSAGITSVALLQDSPSYEIYGRAEWPAEAKSLLVLALAHEISKPELDWWDDKQGGSPGNRQLESIAIGLCRWLSEELRINAWPLSYHVEKGGIFLKDAAALAGLGTIGKNNLLVTPEFGPRVRFRALSFEAELESTGPIDFTPCETCDMSCRAACPQKALKSGYYIRASCNKQMKEDEANRIILEDTGNPDYPGFCTRYCRACELACPVAR